MDLTKFEKHLGKKAILKLPNDTGGFDEFEFEQIDYETFGELLGSIGKYASNPEEGMKDPEVIKKLQGILFKIVKTNYPDLDDEKVKKFVVTNFKALSQFLKKIMPQGESGEKMDLIKDKLKRIQDAKRKDIEQARKEKQ